VFFSWLKRRRRRAILKRPVPPEWSEFLARHVPHCAVLTAAERSKLDDDVRLLVAEKRWEGCGGLALTDEIQVGIAGQACLLTLGLDIDLYIAVSSILVYPAGYVAPEQEPVSDFVALHGEVERLGEAHHRGPVIVSWRDAREAGRHADNGLNVVIHEFAHQIDMRLGAADGVPPLGDRTLARRWQQVMSREFERLVRAADRGRVTLLDHYGAENEAEFFAVITECFFIQPLQLQREHRELYDLLTEFYRQDPAARLR
jgi:Mlc titration factor MtfA (ptsG expression regulator)